MTPLILAPLIRQLRIERLRGLAKNPVAILGARERERGLRLAENLRQRSGGGRKVGAPGDPRGAECLDDGAEEALRGRIAPFRRSDVDGRDLEKHLAVAHEIEEWLVGRERGPVDEMRPRQLVREEVQ